MRKETLKVGILNNTQLTKSELNVFKNNVVKFTRFKDVEFCSIEDSYGDFGLTVNMFLLCIFENNKITPTSDFHNIDNYLKSTKRIDISKKEYEILRMSSHIPMIGLGNGSILLYELMGGSVINYVENYHKNKSDVIIPDSIKSRIIGSYKPRGSYIQCIIPRVFNIDGNDLEIFSFKSRFTSNEYYDYNGKNILKDLGKDFIETVGYRLNNKLGIACNYNEFINQYLTYFRNFLISNFK